ncbi:DUF2264 domain-containing protein [Lutibacter sp. B1]|uniref:DUF2264 domain-containing protein n=1 Tax=Lutibacter sp. B1 TaxID=2725996 RepID=UPI0014575C38|nr:DUF2264 domain-containing protein [Lutibacter sp. B1]NLP56870.1 DUF2264 domain-containing protein [Lutibacter sp. B1]
MKTISSLILSILLLSPVFSQQEIPQKIANNNIFNIVNPDYELSPYTGMTKQHWRDAALYLLEGAFSYINTLDDPMKFPKQPGKSYPTSESQVPTEKLEGLCRTLFIASPLLKENPSLVVNNIKVADYYRYQIVKLIDPNSESYIVPRPKNAGPSQNLVEFGALALSLLTNSKILWDPLSQSQKDALAKTMLSYGDGPTVDSNWKFFNIFVLSFFKDQGYPVNEKLLEEYLQKSLEHYRGDGWYNDAPAYDYYSMWAFQMYGMIWSEYFGKEYYPEYATKFKKNFKDLKHNYPYMFSKNGEMIMWGRSISYRIGAIIPFPLMGFENDTDTNYGWMRRISSGVLKQFLQHPDFMKDNVPTLGFYGAFEPAVQIYSCRGSVYWMGKAFLGLLVPDDNPFWTATENKGAWDKEFEKDEVYTKFQKGSEILITDYPNIGASEIRAWCHEKVKDDWQKFRSTENYNRLSYNSAFLWQADGANGEVAMNYVLKNKKQEWEALRLYTFKKFEDGIYYRNVVLETNENIKLNLADIPLANGILRVDKNISTEVIPMRLGHYALPKLDGEIKTTITKVKGYEVTIIDNGKYQLAMVPLLGWTKTEVVKSKGLNPSSEESSVINVSANFNPNLENNIYATLMLWKKSGEKWSKKELLPIKKMNYSKETNSVTVTMINGDTKVVKYD